MVLVHGVTHSISDDGHYNVTVTGPPPPPSNWDVDPYDYDNQRCGGDTCLGFSYAHSTVPYFTMDIPRSITLTYQSERADPRPVVWVNLTNPSGTSPTEVRFQVKRDETQSFMTFVNGEQTLRFLPHPSGQTRIGARLDVSGLTTGMYDIEILVTWITSSGTTVQSWPTELMVVNEASSPYGAGWNIAGVQRAYRQADGSLLITEGDGSAVYFERGESGWGSPLGEFSKVVANGSGYRRLYPDSTDVRFNSSGRMTDVYDPHNNRTRFWYDGSDRLTLVRDPMGKEISLTYVYPGIQILPAVGSPNRVTKYTLSAGKLTKIQDPDGKFTAFGYSGKYVTSVTNRSGHTTTMTYLPVTGELDRTTGPAVTLADGSSANPQVRQWPVTEYTATAPTASSPKSGQHPLNITTRLLDPGGNENWRYGDKIWIWHNRFMDPTQITAPLRTRYVADYSVEGLPVVQRHWGWGLDSMTAGWGRDTVKYDGNGMPVWFRSATSEASPRQIQYSGTFPTRPVSTWGGGGPSVQYGIGVNGRVDWTGVAGGTTNYAYNTRGQVEQVTNAEGHLVAKYTYDPVTGNRTKDSLPGNRVTVYGRDGYGRIRTVSPPEGPTVTTTYDVMNRRLTVDDGVNLKTTRFSYGPDSVAVTDPLDQVYVTNFNAAGWVVKTVDPNGKIDEYKYDIEGRPVKWKNRRGQTITYAYDALNRVTSVTTTAGTVTTTYDEPTNGRIVTTANGVTTETTYLNARAQPDSVKTYFTGLNKTYWLRYWYTTDGLLDSITPSGPDWPFAKSAYGYDVSAGRMTSVKFGGAVTSFGFYLDQALKNITRSDGKVTNITRTTLNTSSAATSTGAYAGSVDRHDGFDRLNRITLNLFPQGIETWGNQFGYDGLGRLVADTLRVYDLGTCSPDTDDGYEACIPNPTPLAIDTFAYDPVGNRTDAGTYATGNRVQTFAGCTYTHDFDGNIETETCSGATTIYGWSSDNRLQSVTKGGSTYQLHYDGAGRLVRLDLNGSPQRYFLWNGQNLAAELGASGSRVLEYSYYPGLDNLHAVKSSAGVHEAHTDALGNVVALTKSNQIKRTYRYADWGVLTAGDDPGGFNDADRSRWKGALHFGELDDLYYMRNRWYDPETGRFLSEDPIGLEGGINQYVFAGDDPINGRDPTGLSEVCKRNHMWRHRVYYTPDGIVEDVIYLGSFWACTEAGESGGLPVIPSNNGLPERGHGGGPGSPDGLPPQLIPEVSFEHCVAGRIAPVREFAEAVGKQTAILGGEVVAVGYVLLKRGEQLARQAFANEHQPPLGAKQFRRFAPGDLAPRGFARPFMAVGRRILQAVPWAAVAISGFAIGYGGATLAICGVS